MSKHAWHRMAPGEYVTRIGHVELKVTRSGGAWHGTRNGENITGWGYPTIAQCKRVLEAYTFGKVAA